MVQKDEKVDFCKFYNFPNEAGAAHEQFEDKLWRKQVLHVDGV